MATDGQLQFQEFKPEVESIGAYLERVDMYILANDIAKQKQVPVFLSIIGAKTFSLLRDLLAPIKPHEKSLTELTDTLRMHYEPKLRQQKTIFGGVYVQDGTEGLASYHFNEIESYISYSAAPPSWRLDDGSPPPMKKPFLNASYDASTRTFRAVVDWSRVNFDGDAKWIYRMVFSEDFTRIEGGEYLSYGAAGEKREWLAYGQDVFYDKL